MTDSKLSKQYSWESVEDKWYQHWLNAGYFHADANSEKPPYTIVIPPPNVTGVLTMGHVLNNTIQDILIRKARMEGKNACWIPGTDHASIATEGKVTAKLEKDDISKNEISREEFLKHAWAWKNEYGGIIIRQLKKLGCSCDWERERFTMDEGYSHAVLEAFIKLHEKGFIYRGHRLVNWCPASQSAISDEEVNHKEINGKLWHFRYPVEGSGEHVIVATTRPETMLGDTAVAVHPDDKRYKQLHGKFVLLPLADRKIPIITDEYVDMEFGTGCVKVTPAHDPNDFIMGENHELEFISIMNADASLNDNAPEPYRGLSREDARKAVLSDLGKQGFLEKTEDYLHKVGYSERGNVPIEYYLSDQWFVKMKDLASPAIEAVKSGKIAFHPDHWTKTYDHWMENIKDWCISRQLIWGHRIPVWYCRGMDKDQCKMECRETVVSIAQPEACSVCGSKDMVQDPDVLDTWASSWLWPFGVHDWPNDSDELKKFYPTNVLVTGPDIIFFWVARMIMAGQEFCGDITFSDVYFTSILRDEKGQKFSKSLGNSPDPFDLFEKYGTDAVRFGIMLMAPQGLDVLFSESRLEVGRNFMNKLWNAARFVQMNLKDGELPLDEIDTESLDLPERWILFRLNQTIDQFERRMDKFHFNEAAKTLYEFTWSDYCDWYVEIAKTRFQSGDEAKAEAARAVAVKVLKNILKLLHAYAPFITEELWASFKSDDETDLIVSSWPSKTELTEKMDEIASMEILKEVISAVRTIRSRMNVPPASKANVLVRSPNGSAGVLKEYESIVKSLAKVEDMTLGESIKKPDHSATAVIRQMEIFVPLEGLIDLDIERARLTKRQTELDGFIIQIQKKLSNDNFLSRAPEDVVQNEKEKLADMEAELERINSNLEMLS